MILTPLLSWADNPDVAGPSAQVSCNFSLDPVARVNLRGSYHDNTVLPKVITCDNTANGVNVTLTFANVQYFVSSNSRASFSIPDASQSIDAAGASGSTILTFYLSIRDAPPDQPNYSAIVNAAVAAAFQPGFIIADAGVIPPATWVICDGASYLVAAQPSLFGRIGYSYGGAGLNFNVPDLRDRVPIGVSPGALAGNRPTARVIGATGGEETHALTVPELATHSHGVTDPTHTHALGFSLSCQVGASQNTIDSGGVFNSAFVAAAATGITIQNTGTGTAHNVMQPFQVIGNYIIKL